MYGKMECSLENRGQDGNQSGVRVETGLREKGRDWL